ncbi:ALF repeat-containing protein [Antribacter sp. KLBMP9083]|uniref:ALF repeat-containing protein n=1 Tax=Antribacter soli TaxID=2910976 RepID=A0AA41U7V3_9MICO|nr:ALF repeat-containing protein [Antribacter soli]MCF4122368.1 ALF repeat-containing protein [Antribacter soli]
MPPSPCVYDEECVLVRNLVRLLGVAAVLSVVGFGPGAVPAAAADPVTDLRVFVEAGFHGTSDAEYRAWAEVLATTTDGPALRQAATEALAGTDEQLRAFVDGGYRAAWYADERLRVARVLDAATGPAVKAGAQAALDSSDPQALSEFLSTGLAQAQYADDRLAAATMLTGGANNSGPALDAAAQAALAGTAADLREFLLNGQFTARALDAKAAAPAAPAAAADAPAASGQPEGAAAPPAAVAEDPAPVLAATGSSAAAPLAVLAATAVLTGIGLVVLARRRRKA